MTCTCSKVLPRLTTYFSFPTHLSVSIPSCSQPSFPALSSVLHQVLPSVFPAFFSPLHKHLYFFHTHHSPLFMALPVLVGNGMGSLLTLPAVSSPSLSAHQTRKAFVLQDTPPSWLWLGSLSPRSSSFCPGSLFLHANPSMLAKKSLPFPPPDPYHLSFISFLREGRELYHPSWLNRFCWVYSVPLQQIKLLRKVEMALG